MKKNVFYFLAYAIAVGTNLFWVDVFAQNIARHAFSAGFSVEIPTQWRYSEKNYELTNTYFIAHDWQNEQSRAIVELIGLQLSDNQTWDDFLRTQLNNLVDDTLNYNIMLDGARHYPLYVPYSYLSFSTQSTEQFSDTYTQLLLIRRARQVFVIKATTASNLLSDYNTIFNKIFNSFKLETQQYTNPQGKYKLSVPASYSIVTQNTANNYLQIVPTAEAANDTVSASISLIYLPTNDSTTLNDWVANEALDVMLQYTNGQNPIEQDTTFFASNTPVKVLKYATTIGTTPIDVENYYWFLADKQYILSATYQTKQKKATQKMLQSIISDFLIINY